MYIFLLVVASINAAFATMPDNRIKWLNAGVAIISFGAAIHVLIA